MQLKPKELSADVIELVVFQPKDRETMEKKPQRGAWEKRQAIQVVGLLPEDRESALRVLAYAKQIVDQWWSAD